MYPLSVSKFQFTSCNAGRTLYGQAMPSSGIAAPFKGGGVHIGQWQVAVASGARVAHLLKLAVLDWQVAVASAARVAHLLQRAV